LSTLRVVNRLESRKANKGTRGGSAVESGELAYESGY
jgi:hypothetical protein